MSAQVKGAWDKVSGKADTTAAAATADQTTQRRQEPANNFVRPRQQGEDELMMATKTPAAAGLGTFAKVWLRQTYALLIKNVFVMFVRRPLLALVVIISPAFFIWLISLAPSTIASFEVDDATAESVAEAMEWPTPPLTCTTDESGRKYLKPDDDAATRRCSAPIFFAPANNVTIPIMEAVSLKYGYTMGTDVIGETSIYELTSRFYDPTQQLFIAAAVLFTDRGESKRVAMNVFTNSSYSAFDENSEKLVWPIISESINARIENGTQDVSLTVRRASFTDITEEKDLSPDYRNGRQAKGDMGSWQALLLPLLLVVSYFPLMFATTRYIGGETQQGLIAPLRRLGLYESAYICSNFLSLILLDLVAATSATIAAKACGSSIPIFGATNTMILFMTFASFGAAMVGLGLFLSALPWPKAVNVLIGMVPISAVIFIMVMTIMSWIFQNPLTQSPSMFHHYYHPGRETKNALLAGLPWFVFCKMLDDMAIRTTFATVNDTTSNTRRLDRGVTYELPEFWQPQPQQITDIGTRLATYNPPSGAESATLLILVGLVYMMMGWYFSQVLPSTFSVAKPFYFPISPAFWRGYQSKSTYISEGDTLSLLQKESQRHHSVILKKLSKTFARTTAVRELSLTLKCGEVTALLGQNGCGKSKITIL